MVEEHLLELYKTLRKKVTEHADILKQRHQYFAADRNGTGPMLEVIRNLEEIAHEDQEELVTFYAYPHLEKTDKGVVPVREAVKIARGRLNNCWQKEVSEILKKSENLLQKEHAPHEARQTLQRLDYYCRMAERENLPSNSDDLQERIQTLNEKVESELLAYENAQRQIAQALSVAEDDPQQALVCWEEAKKEYFWLVNKAKDKKKKLYKYCEKWIEKYLQEAESEDENESAQFYLNAVGQLLEQDRKLEMSYGNRYRTLLRSLQNDEEHGEK